jgi:hypothetical protein
LLHGRVVLTLLHILVTHHLLPHARAKVRSLASGTLVSEVTFGILCTGMHSPVRMIILLLHVLLLLE